MIDSILGARVVVLEDSVYGPYIIVSGFEDSSILEDLLDDKYHIPYWIKRPAPLLSLGGNEYYFGWVVDTVKLQKILDSIG